MRKEIPVNKADMEITPERKAKIMDILLEIYERQEGIKLVVKENGIGIHNDEIKNVMKRFYKVDKSRVHNNSFGIGLSIADRIIKELL